VQTDLDRFGAVDNVTIGQNEAVWRNKESASAPFASFPKRRIFDLNIDDRRRDIGRGAADGLRIRVEQLIVGQRASDRSQRFGGVFKEDWNPRRLKFR